MFLPNAAASDTASLVNLRLEVGQEYTLVITNTDQDCTLEFQHGNDATWRPFPGLTGTAVNDVIVLPFRCISGVMRVKFAAGPTGASSISAAPVIMNTF